MRLLDAGDGKLARARDSPRQISSRRSGPAWRKSSKYLAFALGEVSLTRVNLPRAVLVARRSSRRYRWGQGRPPAGGVQVKALASDGARSQRAAEADNVPRLFRHDFRSGCKRERWAVPRDAGCG